jgi:hypothetical protein
MTSFSNFFSAAARKAEDPEEKDGIFRLRRMAIESVHMVGAGANKRRFLIRKDEEGSPMKTIDMLPAATVTKDEDGVKIVKTAELTEALTKASDRLLALSKKVEGVTEGEAALAKDFVSELKSVSKAVADMGGDDDAEKEAKAKKAKAEAEKKQFPPKPDDEEGDEETEKKIKKAVADAMAEQADSADPFDVIETELAVIQKAGARMSKGNLEIFTKAMELLQKLSVNLTPEEKAKVQEKVKTIAKSVEPPAAPAHISDGKSKPAEAPIPAPEGGGWNTYEDINAK